MGNVPEGLENIWNSTALQLAPDEDALKARLAYRPAFSFADLAEYAGHVWGMFVAIGGVTAVQSLSEGALKKVGEELGGAAWKRFQTVFSKSPLEKMHGEQDGAETRAELIEADAASRRLIAQHPEALKQFLDAGTRAAEDLMKRDGLPAETASRIAQDLATSVRDRVAGQG